MLFFTGKNGEGKTREFGCRLELLETGLDSLSTMFADGYTLVSAHLMDGINRLNLPVEAFDALLLSVSLRVPENESERALHQSIPESLAHKRTLIDLTYRRIEQHRVAVADYEKMIGYLERWYQATQKNELAPGQPALLGRYERMIANYRQYIKSGQARLALLDRRLRELMA